jgi:hypothetical protein
MRTADQVFAQAHALNMAPTFKVNAAGHGRYRIGIAKAWLDLENFTRRVAIIQEKETRAQACDVRRATTGDGFMCGYCRRTRGTAK